MFEARPVRSAIPAGLHAFFEEYFAAKSSGSPERAMAFFDRSNTTYIDAIVGWSFTWESLRALLEEYAVGRQVMGRSYATRILGDESGAVVFFANAPEGELGHEIVGLAVVDIRVGRFVRWIDYWDGRRFGVAPTEGLRVPPSEFPLDFGEASSGEHASPMLARTVTALMRSLRRGDAEGASELFAESGALEDLTLQTQVVGRASIARYLERAGSFLPYGRRARLRHIVGGPFGGGYEWTNDFGPVPRGLNAVELNIRGEITRLSSIWDGSLVEPAWLAGQEALAVEIERDAS